jgi:hypothetical protein
MLCYVFLHKLAVFLEEKIANFSNFFAKYFKNRNIDSWLIVRTLRVAVQRTFWPLRPAQNGYEQNERKKRKP